MQTYSIQGPDGKTYNIDGPEGATREQVIAKIQERMSPTQSPQEAAQPTAPEKEAEPWYEDFGEGIAASGMGTYYGIQDLFGRFDDEEKARLKDWQDDAAESGWGTAGNVVGELAQLAIPGGALVKASKMANKLGRAAKASPLAREAVSASTVAGLKYADEEAGETRLGNIGRDLLGVGAGAAINKTVGSVLRKALKGVNKTPEAEAMMARGIDLTPAKASQSGTLKALEGVMAITPLSAGATKRARQKMMGQWNKDVIGAVAPPGSSITSTGQEGAEQLYKGFNDAYDAAWGKANKPSNAGLVSIVNQAEAVGKELSGSAPGVARKIMTDLKDLSQNFTSKGLKSFDNRLRKAIENAFGGANPHYELGDALKEMRKTLRDSVGADSAKALKAVDKQYAKYIPVRQAMGTQRALLEGGQFDVEMLASGLKSAASESQRGRGAHPMSSALTEGLATVGRRDPAVLPDALKVFSSNIYSPDAPFKLASKMMLGQTAPQRLGVKAGQSDIGRILREYASPERLGAAIVQ